MFFLQCPKHPAKSRAMPKIHVIHENDAWLAPFRDAFFAIRAPHEEWFLDRGLLDLTRPPPEGVFWNRMSASSHTRGHVYAPEYAAAVIEWLERHGRVVVNGRRALQLELSKVAQYEALAAFGIPTPATVAVVGEQHIRDAASRIGFPLILKHNRAGKGLGVRLVRSAAALEEAAARIAASEDPHAFPRDGVWLVQRYIAAPEPFITRAEFVGGRFVYAVRVDTSEGFELCPADACQVPEGAACPAVAPAEKFRILDGFAHPLVPAMEAFPRANGIGVGAIEFITDAAGATFAYDVNTNTNYNPQAEKRAGVSAPLAVARHLAALLPRAAVAA
jgi:GNAT superfamily N-acetyltransferase